MISKELDKKITEMQSVIAGLSKRISILEDRLAHAKDAAERNSVNLKQLKDFVSENKSYS